MQAPGAAIALVFSIVLAYSSDRFRERGIHIAIAMLLAFGGCFWLAMAPADVGRRVLYGGYLLTAGTMGTGQAINAVSHLSGFRTIADCLAVMAEQQDGRKTQTDCSSCVVSRSYHERWLTSVSCPYSSQGLLAQMCSKQPTPHDTREA
jgi:hypothetical protein